MMEGSNIEGESLSCQLHFRSAHKTKRNASALKLREVYIPSGSRYGNGPNELVHRAGAPFLDNHYRSYQ